MYDTLADEEEFREADAMIGRFAATLDQSRPYTTREFLNLLGKELSRRTKEDGIVTAAFMRNSTEGHKYAMQVVTDAPHWGGLSGCTLEEAQSWGKITHDASMVTVHCDSTSPCRSWFRHFLKTPPSSAAARNRCFPWGGSSNSHFPSSDNPHLWGALAMFY